MYKTIWLDSHPLIQLIYNSDTNVFDVYANTAHLIQFNFKEDVVYVFRSKVNPKLTLKIGDHLMKVKWYNYHNDRPELNEIVNLEFISTCVKRICEVLGCKHVGI